VKPLSFSSFIEKYRNCHEKRIDKLLIFKFEGCIAQSKSEKSCDYAIAVQDEQQLFLIECKDGKVSLRDFDQGIKQLENSIEIIRKEFKAVPDLAVLCYGKLDHLVLVRLRYIKKLRYNVRFAAKRLAEKYCIACK